VELIGKKSRGRQEEGGKNPGPNEGEEAPAKNRKTKGRAEKDHNIGTRGQKGAKSLERKRGAVFGTGALVGQEENGRAD